ncbi:MAG: glycosyltransferase family 1 protein [Chloroflexota bacterium]|nr:glycosyltransferase family 1 protein [Chloroflexota bacterium]
MRHIGIDARLTHYRTGGISTYIRRLVQALELLDARNRYTVFHSRKMRETITTRFRRASLWTPAHHRTERLALSVELARFNLDLFHSPDFIPPLSGAKRHIITVHDLTFLHYPQHLTADARRYYNDQIAAAVRHADHILTDSEASKRDMIAMLHVPPEQITVHMLGVDESFRPPDQAALKACREALDLPLGYILFVGTFEPRKNIAGLLRAYRLLLDRLPNAPPLVLAGTRGWLFDETMRDIALLHLGDRVLWRENIPQASMPALYGLARVLVVPSFYEGFGLTALEAMACGTPTIVSNRSSLPEVVGAVGLQVNPDDDNHIAKALHTGVVDEDWHTNESAKAIVRAAQFRWEDTARIALSVYESVMS